MSRAGGRDKDRREQYQDHLNMRQAVKRAYRFTVCFFTKIPRTASPGDSTYSDRVFHKNMLWFNRPPIA